MKIIRYLLRGIQEVARELSGVKRIVRPKRVQPPALGRVEEVLRYLLISHSLEGIYLYDSRGVLVSSSKRRVSNDIFEQVAPVFDELDVTYLFLKRGGVWTTIFRHRGFYLVLDAPYKPDIVDIWVIKREFDRYMWGY